MEKQQETRDRHEMDMEKRGLIFGMDLAIKHCDNMYLT